MIARRALAEPPRGAAASHADQIEHAVGVEIEDREDVAARRRVERLQLMVAAGQPDAGLTTSRRDQVERAVVIQIGGDQTVAAW